MKVALRTQGLRPIFAPSTERFASNYAQAKTSTTKIFHESVAAMLKYLSGISFLLLGACGGADDTLGAPPVDTADPSSPATGGASGGGSSAPSGGANAEGTGGNDSATGGQDPVGFPETCGQSVAELIAEELPEGTLTDERDGQVYRTVTIGSQTWMAENLNIGERVDLAVNQLDDTKIEKFCIHDCNEACDVFGGLYTKPEAYALPSRCLEDSDNGCLLDPDQVGICPAGWRLPDRDDWGLLVETIEIDVGEHYAGNAVRSTEGWLPRESGAEGNGTDSYGFRALPVGAMVVGENFGFGTRGWFAYGERSAYGWTARKLENGMRPFSFGAIDNATAVSVRCIQD